MTVTEETEKGLLQFIPSEYLYLTKVKKIKYKGVNLKTDLIINMLNEFIVKYYFSKEEYNDNEVKINIWSILLKSKYGEHYNFYMEYLVDKDFLFMISDYYRCKKARTYKLNTFKLINITRVTVYDKVLIKKYSKESMNKSFLSYSNSPIPMYIREKLRDDLYKSEIDIDAATNYLNKLKESGNISYNKLQKNMISIDNISIKNMFFKFDEYGRMHTNFTVLKKAIRRNFITLNGEQLIENDVENSQPLFLAVLMKNNLPKSKLFSPELNRYFDLVKNGLLYEEFMTRCNINNRDEVKNIIYKVFFGINNTSKNNRIFKKLFPTVYNFIVEYKELKKDYKSLSHALQRLESKFIFENVIAHIMRSYPNIPIITIHDSICYPIKYRKEVKDIFDYYKRKLLEDTNEY